MVEGHHQGETLLDKDSVAILIYHIKESPGDNETVIGNYSVQELSGEQRVVRFHLAKEETATTSLERIVMVSPRAPAQSTRDHENAYPPPASACHGLPPFAALAVWHGPINFGRATGGGPVVSILSVDKDVMLSVKRVSLASGTTSIHVLMCLPCPYQAIGKHSIVPRIFANLGLMLATRANACHDVYLPT